MAKTVYDYMSEDEVALIKEYEAKAMANKAAAKAAPKEKKPLTDEQKKAKYLKKIEYYRALAASLDEESTTAEALDDLD